MVENILCIHDSARESRVAFLSSVSQCSSGIRRGFGDYSKHPLIINLPNDMPKELTSNFNANSLAVVELCQRLAEEKDDKQKKKQNK